MFFFKSNRTYPRNVSKSMVSVPYQVQTGTRNNKTRITRWKMICTWGVISAIMRLDVSCYCIYLFFKKINLGHFTLTKLCAL